MKIIKESDKTYEFDRPHVIWLLKRAGKLGDVDLNDNRDYSDLNMWIFNYQECKKLHISEREIQRLFLVADGYDDIGKILADKYGNTKKYADLYPTDDSIPYNKKRLKKGA